MTTATLEHSLLGKLLAQVPAEPDLISTDQDGYTEVQWVLGGRVVQLDLEPGAVRAEWITWREEDALEDEPPVNGIDLRDRDSWQPLLELLAC